MDVTTVEEWIEGKQLKSSEDGGVDQQISDSQPSESRLTDSQLMSSKLAIAQSTKSKPSFLQCTNSKLTFLNRDSNMTENHTESHHPNSELANSQHTSSNPTDTQTTDMQTTDTQTTNSNLPLLQPNSNIAESQNTNSELAESDSSNTYSKFTNEQNIPRMEPDIMDSIQNTCDQLLQANLEYLFLVGMKRDSGIQGAKFQSPRGASFLNSQSVDLLKEFLYHCYGGTNVNSAETRVVIENESNRDTGAAEGQQVKVIDKVFTGVKDKSDHVKEELLEVKEEEQMKDTPLRKKRKRQDSVITETEEFQTFDEDSDDFCNDIYTDGDYDDDNDEDWQFEQEQRNKKVKGPKGKSVKLKDLDYKSKATNKGSRRNTAPNTSDESTQDITANRSTRYNTRQKTTTTSNRKAANNSKLGKRSRITNEQSSSKTRRKTKGSQEEGNDKADGSQEITYRCSGCQKEFSSELERRLHHKSNVGCCSAKKYVCDVCSAGFMKKSSLLYHQRRGHKAEKGKIHICVRCNEEFQTKHELLAHAKKHDKRVCLICKEVFSEEEAYEEHKMKHKHDEMVVGERDIKMTCVNCEQAFFVGKEQSDSCSMLCEECCNNQYSCQHCQQKYKLFYFLAMHDCKKSFAKNMEEIKAVDFRKFHGKLTCHLCQKEFDCRKNLCSHYQLHSSDTRYQCDICWRYYKDVSKLRKHKRVVHTEKRKYECTHCGLRYKEKDTLNRHKKTCDLTCTKKSDAEKSGDGDQSGERKEDQSEKTGDQSNEFLCKKCLKVFATERIYAKHRCVGQDGNGEETDEDKDVEEEEMEEETEEEENEESEMAESSCKNCGKNIKNGNKQPLCKLCAKNKFTCSTCHQAFNMFYLLALHDCNKPFKENLLDIKNKKCSNEELICNLCNRSFKNRKSLCSHYRTHYYQGPIQCDICKQTFKHHNSLHKHRRYVHSVNRDFICDICGKAFKQSDTLSTHRRLHTHEKTKEFQCPECGKFLSGSTALSVHMNIHSGALPFICEICGRAFRQYGNMQKHMLVHGTSKTFVCSICPDRSFKHSETYKIHMKTHVLDGTVPDNKYGKIYKCPHCDKQMPSASQYTVHLRTHTNERPFPCKVCSKRFKENGKLKRHMKTHILDQGPKKVRRKTRSEDDGYQSKEAAGYQSNSEPSSMLETITVYPAAEENGQMTQTIAIPVTDNRMNYVPADIPHFSVIDIQNNDKYYRERLVPLD